MTTEEAASGHFVMGCIHELLPLDGSPETLAALLRHECEQCDGARVLIDLTNNDKIDRRHVDVIVDTVPPHDERWKICLHADTDSSILEYVRKAGYDLVGPLVASP